MALITGSSGTAKFNDGDSSHNFTLAAHATTTSSVNYTWPPADGSNGEMLSTNSSGVLSWAAATSTKVALTAYPSATISNVTGSGEPGYDIVWNTEINDAGNDFNTSNGVFTAPRTGMYLVATSMRLHGITSSHNRSLIYMKVAGTSARNYVSDCGDPHSFMSNGSHVSISQTAIVHMTATDTLTINVHVFGSSDDIDIAGGSYPVSWVSIAEL